MCEYTRRIVLFLLQFINETIVIDQSNTTLQHHTVYSATVY